MSEPKVISECVITNFEKREDAKISSRIKVVEALVKVVCKDKSDAEDRYVEVDMREIEVEPDLFLDDGKFMICATLKVDPEKHKCRILKAGDKKADNSRLLIIDDSVDQSDIDEMEDLEKELKPENK